MSSFGSEGAPSYLNAAGEVWINALWRKYSFPPKVRVSFPPPGPEFVASIEEDRGGMNYMYWLEIHISEGLRFPLPAQVHKFFHHTRLHPIHTHMNIICVLLEVCVLNRQYGICLGLEEVLYVYTIKRKNLGKYYFVVDAKLV